MQAWLAAGHERGSAGASGTQRSGKRPIKRPAHHSTDSEEEASMDEQESLGACFKDAEYSKEWKEIYFSVGRFDKKNRAFFLLGRKVKGLLEIYWPARVLCITKYGS